MNQLMIPHLGDSFTLAEAWEFDLYREDRNYPLAHLFGILDVNGNWSTSFVKSVVTFPAHTTLKVERIYIRQGKRESDSITFRVMGAVVEDGKETSPFVGKRFWVKLDDANKIIYYGLVIAPRRDVMKKLSLNRVRELAESICVYAGLIWLPDKWPCGDLAPQWCRVYNLFSVARPVLLGEGHLKRSFAAILHKHDPKSWDSQVSCSARLDVVTSDKFESARLIITEKGREDSGDVFDVSQDETTPGGWKFTPIV